VAAQLPLLFGEPTGPEGLTYQSEFISVEAARILIKQIRSLPLAPFQFGAFEGKRRVASLRMALRLHQSRASGGGRNTRLARTGHRKSGVFAGLTQEPIRQISAPNMNPGPGLAGIG
jgi:hypothetical protein